MATGADYGRNWRAPRVDVHQFSMIPRASIPRSTFRMQHQHKTTFSAGHLIPVYLQEVLPGDSFNVTMTCFVRMATPVYPIMDNMDLESFFFYVPCRLVWKNWKRFMGEQPDPSMSTSFVIPTVQSPVGGFPPFSVADYFGLPTTGQLLSANFINVSALPFRCYALIHQEWFRDENLMLANAVGSTGQWPAPENMDDGPDPWTNYQILKPVAKRHDYFTSCLPWTQKGSAVQLPLGGSAPIRTSAPLSYVPPWLTASAYPIEYIGTNNVTIQQPGAGQVPVFAAGTAGGAPITLGAATGASPSSFGLVPTNLFADLSLATAATINAIRLAFQTQKLLERDARGGTRYTEIIRSHFGVMSPDMRQQRPEYLGGGKTPVNITPVPQTTQPSGTQPPMGTLAAVGTGLQRHGFRQSFTEHGYVLGLVTVRRDQIYQQGIRRMWARSTRYDFFWPVFSALGEQGILNQEIFAQGADVDLAVFGFQERWAEYRYHPSFTSGYFRSTTAGTLDSWHLATRFTNLPALNQAFIFDDTSVVLNRVLAGATQAQDQQFLADFFFDERAARPMPTYSVPGLIDHF